MISAELTQEGELDPNDDDYWDELDTRLKDYNVKVVKRKGQQNQNDDDEEQEQPKQKRKSSPVGSRRDEDGESDGPSFNKQFVRKGDTIIANPTVQDKEMADRLGINVNEFMKEKYKYAKQDYKGYVTIDIPGQ